MSRMGNRRGQPIKPESAWWQELQDQNERQQARRQAQAKAKVEQLEQEP